MSTALVSWRDLRINCPTLDDGLGGFMTSQRYRARVLYTLVLPLHGHPCRATLLWSTSRRTGFPLRGSASPGKRSPASLAPAPLARAARAPARQHRTLPLIERCARESGVRASRSTPQPQVEWRCAPDPYGPRTLFGRALCGGLVRHQLERRPSRAPFGYHARPRGISS